MKLRNKKTGEIGTLYQNGEGVFYEIWVSASGHKYLVDSLAELNEDWEDVEPEEVWYIDFQGVVRSASKEENDWFKESEIGNCFETKEEAEKAVEKLKAWKRLKDKGFKFRKLRRYLLTDGGLDIRLSKSEYWEDEQVKADLDLLFGGEE